jgi:hypothetical protein
MNKEYIDEIQKKILNFLPKDKYLEKGLLLGHCCSELSRLVGSWIHEDDSFSRQIILKGKNVQGTNKSHDILVSINNDIVYLIDPTIWQFFPKDNTILIGKYSSIDNAIYAASKKYGGRWQKSEEIKETSSEEKNEWIKIIKENIHEAICRI